MASFDVLLGKLVHHSHNSAELPDHATPISEVVEIGASSSIGSTKFNDLDGAELELPGDGLYRANVYLQVASSATSGTMDVTLGWDDTSAARTEKVINGYDISATGFAPATALFRGMNGRNITYSTSLNNLVGTITYNLYIVVERIMKFISDMGSYYSEKYFARTYFNGRYFG